MVQPSDASFYLALASATVSESMAWDANAFISGPDGEAVAPERRDAFASDRERKREGE